MTIQPEFYAAIGIVITLIGYSVYIYSIVRGQTQPHPFSWIIWGSLTAIAFFAQLSDNAGPGAWITGLTAFISLCIVGLAYYKNRSFTIAKSDWVTFLLGVTAIPLWYITSNPLWAVLLITVIDALGFYPTFRKSWHHPGTELPFHYLTSGLKFVFALLALTHISIITTLYPASLVVMNFAFIIVLYWRRKVIYGKTRL